MTTSPALIYLGAVLTVVVVLGGAGVALVKGIPRSLRLMVVLAAVWHLILLGLVAHLGYGFFHVDDPIQYDRVAAWLADQWRQGILASVERTWTISSFGYYYWLGALYRVFGHHPLIGQLVNVIFALLVGVVTFRLTRRLLGSDRIAWLASVGALFYPTLATWSVMLLKDMAAGILFLACLEQILAASERPTLWRWLFLGIIGFLVSTIRFYYAAMALALGIVMPWLLSVRPRWQAFLGAALSLVALLATFGVGEGKWYVQAFQTHGRIAYEIANYARGGSTLDAELAQKVTDTPQPISPVTGPGTQAPQSTVVKTPAPPTPPATGSTTQPPQSTVVKTPAPTAPPATGASPQPPQSTGTETPAPTAPPATGASPQPPQGTGADTPPPATPPATGASTQPPQGTGAKNPAPATPSVVGRTSGHPSVAAGRTVPSVRPPAAAPPAIGSSTRAPKGTGAGKPAPAAPSVVGRTSGPQLRAAGGGAPSVQPPAPSGSKSSGVLEDTPILPSGKVLSWRLLRFFLVPLPGQTGSRLLQIGKLDWLFWWPLLILSLFGLKRALTLSWRRALVVALPAGALILFYAVVVANSGTLLRYRSTLYPLFAVLGGLGVDHLRNTLPERVRTLWKRSA